MIRSKYEELHGLDNGEVMTLDEFRSWLHEVLNEDDSEDEE